VRLGRHRLPAGDHPNGRESNSARCVTAATVHLEQVRETLATLPARRLSERAATIC
jgi:hypothetical protein